MCPVPGWAVASAACAPVVLIGGWTLAAARQPAGYDPVSATISSLAAIGANDRWLMTSALTALGVCHFVTAVGLRPAGLAGRVVLAVGGVATVLVAAFPLSRDGTSSRHTVAAAVAFGALAVWPALAGRRGRPVPLGLRPAVSAVATTVLVGLVGCFVATLDGRGPVGLTERVAAGAQALWPLLVAASAAFERD